MWHGQDSAHTKPLAAQALQSNAWHVPSQLLWIKWSCPSLPRNKCQLPKKLAVLLESLVGGYVVNREKWGGSWDFFSSGFLPGPGNDQPKQPFEIFLSFYEELQVFTKTLMKTNQVENKHAIQKILIKTTESKKKILQKRHRSQGRVWNKFGSIAGSVRYQEAFSQTIEGDSAKDEERSFQKGMRNTATKDGKATEALNEYLHVYNKDAQKSVRWHWLYICYLERIQKQLRKSNKLTGAVEMKDTTTGILSCMRARAGSNWICQCHVCTQWRWAQPVDCREDSEAVPSTGTTLPTGVWARRNLTLTETVDKVTSMTRLKKLK